MTPLIENLLVSLFTGFTASATFVLGLSPSTPRDWVVIVATGILAAGGAFGNGLRQLHKEPT
jgi:hypothetical protein